MVPWECLRYKPDNLGSNSSIHVKVHLTHLKASAGVCNTSGLMGRWEAASLAFTIAKRSCLKVEKQRLAPKFIL